MEKLLEYQKIDAELKAIEQELSSNEDRKKGIVAKKSKLVRSSDISIAVHLTDTLSMSVFLRARISTLSFRQQFTQQEIWANQVAHNRQTAHASVMAKVGCTKSTTTLTHSTTISRHM